MSFGVARWTYTRAFRKQYVQIKYLEASGPGLPVAHRFEPLPGSMQAHTKKRHRNDVEQKTQAKNYANMLHNLMVEIQEYLLLSDDDTQRGAVKSLELVDSTAQQRQDNMICIWLKEDIDW